MKRMRWLAGTAALGVALGCSVEPNPAELVVRGGVVWTGDDTVTAVAVRDGQVLAVGSDAEVAQYVGPDTRTIELDGRMVTPGFIDDHTHFISGGFQLASVDLRDAATPEEFVRRIAAFAEDVPEGRWITGGNWDHELWDGAPLPERGWIDSVTATVPVFVSRLDGHMALSVPHDGAAGRRRRGCVHAGVLKDEAMGLVSASIPDPSEAELDEAFRRAQDHALSLGVTMVVDMGSGSWAHLETYRRAHDAGELVMRVYPFVPLDTWERMEQYVERHGRGDARLRWGGMKGFVDGSLGSTTAWFYEPYSDAPGETGLVVTDTAELRADILDADAAGLQVGIHAIGDRANDWLLDAYEEAIRVNGPRDRRFRIEHAQHLTRDAIGRFAELGVLPAMQPYHAIDDGRWAEKRIGPERVETTYAFRSLLDAGARVMFGTDWTVAPLDPLLGIYAAVTRRTIDGANPGGWVPEEKITLEEALTAYTRSSAYGAFLEDRLGTLRPGMRGDLVVLSENLLELDPVDIPDAHVDYTIVDGVVVYER